MHLLIIFYISLLLTLLFTPFFIEYFTKHKIIDLPGSRRINTQAVPRMGGVLIYFTLISSIICFYSDLNEIKFFILGSVLILIVGVIDDIREVTYKKKFAVQFVTALFLITFLAPNYSTVSLLGFNIPSPFDKAILVLFIVGVINAINLYDGLDGLVTGFSLLIAFVTFLIGWQMQDKLLLILSASLMGSLIGFLKYNSFPAKIFLGDSGSLTLGFFLVTVVLISSTNTNTGNMDLTFSVILLAAPVIDTLKVMAVRILKHKNPFLADKSHIHYIILGSEIRHKATVYILQGFSILFASVAIYYLVSSTIAGIVLFVLLAVPLLFIKRILNVYRKLGLSLSVKKFYMKVSAVHNKFLG